MDLDMDTKSLFSIKLPSDSLQLAVVLSEDCSTVGLLQNLASEARSESGW